MAGAVQRPSPPTGPKRVVPRGPNAGDRNVKASPKKQKQPTTTTTGGLKSTSAASKNVTATPRDPTHLIRVNVLGIAGIAVDRKKCNDISRKKDHPAPPQHMRAVVAVGRGSQIQGTTALSKRLTRSPNDDVIVVGTAVDGDEALPVNNGGSRRRDDEETQGTGLNNLNRHVAVWASEDNFSLGSLVSFDACLNTSSLDQRNSTASVSSKYVPKSFALTVALTEDSKEYNKVALPFGVANINISGDECPEGGTIVLDLPLLSLRQARPLASNKNGLASYQMIAIKPKETEADVAPKKRGAFGRLFRKEKSGKKTPRTPSVAERSRFSEAYSTDPSGDAIIRVQLQVIEKAASKFQRESSLAMTEITPGVKPLKQNTKKDDRSLDTDASTSETQSIEESSFTGTGASAFRSSSEPTVVLKTIQHGDASIISHRTSDSNSLYTEGSRTFPITTSRTVDSDTVGSRTFDSRTVGSETVGSRTFDSRTVDSRTIDSRSLASHTFDTAERKEKERDSIVDDDLGDEQNMSFEERREAQSLVDESDDTLNLTIMRIFGREVRFPACGPFTGMDDDMTHVTADFFGKDVAIPVCSGMKPGDFDEETIFSLRQNDTLSTMTMLPGQATFQSFLGDDNGTNTSKTTEKGVEMRLHRPSSGTVDDMTNSLIRGAAKGSPKGVDKFPEEGQQEKRTRSTSSKRPVSKNMSDRFVQMFRCVPTEVSRSDDAMTYKEAGVPALVVPGDASSVGDLTAITHDLHLDKRRAAPIGSKRYPIACGGNGVCNSTDLVDDSAVLRGFEIQHFSSEAKRLSKENYFSEYDEVNFVGPNTGPQPLKKIESGDASLEMSFNTKSSKSNWAKIPVTITEAASESEWEGPEPQWA